MATKKVTEELFENVEEEDVLGETVLPDEPLSHTMMRSIATTAVPVGGAKSIQQVGAEVSAWLARGYKTVNAQYIGTDSNAIICIWFLEKIR